MNDLSLVCCDETRRNAVREQRRLAGIDYVEVDTDDAGHPILRVFFLSKLPPADASPLFTSDNIRIEGGRRVRNLRGTLESFHRAPTHQRDDWAIIRLNRAGDHSVYTLRLVADAREPASVEPPPGFDPRYAAARFSFAADGPVAIDCAPAPCPPAPPEIRPELSYLAKDYASFRQMLLDRLATTLPTWRERHAADLYLTLIELLAYVGDQLSYYQDAVATEAYLGTARRRISIRRHARLVDYALHEGCNARAWVCVEVRGTVPLSAASVSFVTRPRGCDPDTVTLLPSALRSAPRQSYEVFEPLVEARSRAIHERDIRYPRGMARRLRQPETLLARAVRDRLSDETIALIERVGQPEERLEPLISALAHDLDRLLADSGLARLQLDQARRQRTLASYGTPNALHGDLARAYNRTQLGEELGDALTPPATLVLREAHNEIQFYTWLQSQCCLPRGATSATLRDAWEHTPAGRQRALRYLRKGDVLIFEERISPTTGDPADADPHHRHPVRLTSVECGDDPVDDQPVVEITWADDDALPFDLPLSAIGPAPGCRLLEGLSVARGNVVLVDHGETVEEADAVRLRQDAVTVVANPYPAPYDRVPPDETTSICDCCGGSDEVVVQPGRYEPVLPRAPLVFSEPLPDDTPPAAALIEQDPRRALPRVALFSPLARARPDADVFERLPDAPYLAAREHLYERWQPQPDLLRSSPTDRHVVVEVDDDRRAHQRFGDGQCGARPEPSQRFLAAYRVGGDVAGNVGAEAICHVVLRQSTGDGTIVRVRNPLPARGGQPPETVAQARLLAPHAFRRALRRAITREDYVAIVERDFGSDGRREDAEPVERGFAGRVQRVAASIEPRAGQRADVTVLIDPLGTEEDDPALRQAIGQHLERYRRIGHVVEVRQARYVSLDLHLTVQVHEHYERGAVRAGLMAALGDVLLPDGSLGFFHPDRLTFGQTITVSAIVAAARAVAGVAGVQVTLLKRHDAPPSTAPLPPDGVLQLGTEEIARLANDPDFPEHGSVQFNLKGGR